MSHLTVSLTHSELERRLRDSRRNRNRTFKSSAHLFRRLLPQRKRSVDNLVSRGVGVKQDRGMSEEYYKGAARCVSVCVSVCEEAARPLETTDAGQCLAGADRT